MNQTLYPYLRKVDKTLRIKHLLKQQCTFDIEDKRSFQRATMVKIEIKNILNVPQIIKIPELVSKIARKCSSVLT